LRLAPDYHQAQCLYGVCLLRAGRAAEALQAVTTAVRLNPSYARGWQALGEIHKHLAAHCARKTQQLTNPPSS